jgi:hypothetical protein
MWKSYLTLVQEREYATWTAGVPVTESRIQGLQSPTKPPAEGSKLLRRFCDTGLRSDKDGDLFAKELLYYRVLDLFAQTNDIGVEHTTREKSLVPSMTKLVRYDSSTPERPYMFVQGHSSLDHWPKLINTVITVLEQTSNNITTLDVSSQDVQLYHCFENLRIATNRVHQSNFVHNFAAAGFHLCYILKVCMYVRDLGTG